MLFLSEKEILSFEYSKAKTAQRTIWREFITEEANKKLNGDLKYFPPDNYSEIFKHELDLLKEQDLSKALKGFIQVSRASVAELVIEWLHPKFVELEGGKDRFLKKGESTIINLQGDSVSRISEIFVHDGIKYATVTLIGGLSMNLKKWKNEGVWVWQQALCC